MAKYGMYPQPVYHATLDDGRTIRMTVWQKANAPEKGFDWEACRRMIMVTTDRKDEPRIREWLKPAERRAEFRHPEGRKSAGAKFRQARAFWAWGAPTLEGAGRRIIAAHLEQSGVVLADDPLTVAAPAKRRANNAAIVAALKAYMAGKPEARELAELALAA